MISTALALDIILAASGKSLPPKTLRADSRQESTSAWRLSSARVVVGGDSISLLLSLKAALLPCTN